MADELGKANAEGGGSAASAVRQDLNITGGDNVQLEVAWTRLHAGLRRIAQGLESRAKYRIDVRLMPQSRQLGVKGQRWSGLIHVLRAGTHWDGKIGDGRRDIMMLFCKESGALVGPELAEVPDVNKPEVYCPHCKHLVHITHLNNTITFGVDSLRTLARKVAQIWSVACQADADIQRRLARPEVIDAHREWDAAGRPTAKYRRLYENARRTEEAVILRRSHIWKRGESRVPVERVVLEFLSS